MEGEAEGHQKLAGFLCHLRAKLLRNNSEIITNTQYHWEEQIYIIYKEKCANFK